MRFAVSTRQPRWIFSRGVALAGLLLGSAHASVIMPTASLPLIGIPYVSPGAGAGCFTIASQQIVANVTYDATLTPPGLDNIIGSVALVGTVDETVVNRTSNSETGTFTVDITGLTLSGPLSLPGSPLDGRTLLVNLDTSNTSSGATTITPDGGVFRIDSFFDVFADITLELPPPLISPSTSVGPILTVAVPEPSTWALMLLSFTGLAFAAQRKARLAA